MTRRHDAALAFAAIRIEVGLINGEYLSKIAHQATWGQANSDYRPPRGLRLRDVGSTAGGGSVPLGIGPHNLWLGGATALSGRWNGSPLVSPPLP